MFGTMKIQFFSPILLNFSRIFAVWNVVPSRWGWDQRYFRSTETASALPHWVVTRVQGQWAAGPKTVLEWFWEHVVPGCCTRTWSSECLVGWSSKKNCQKMTCSAFQCGGCQRSKTMPSWHAVAVACSIVIERYWKHFQTRSGMEWKWMEWIVVCFKLDSWLCTICNGIVMAVYLALQSLGWQISSSASASPPFGSESYRFPGTGNEKLQCATWQDFQGESTSSYFAFNIILSIRQIPQYLKIS